MSTSQTDAGNYGITVYINDSIHCFPGGGQSATATWTIDKLDMEIWAAGIIIYRDSEGAGEVTVTGSDCFGANAEPMSFFDKKKLHAVQGDSEISITAKAGKAKDSNWFDNYTWSYDDNNINVKNINVVDYDYSTLVVDGEEPVVVSAPTINNSITY